MAKTRRAPTSDAIKKRLEAAGKTGKRYMLKLYVAGITPRSATAIQNVKEVLETNLHGRYELEVVDIYRQPVLAKGEQIIAAPTLVKKLPLPLRRLIGDMSNKERVLVGLDLKDKEQ
jgi:circadian clock protein KaiB